MTLMWSQQSGKTSHARPVEKWCKNCQRSTKIAKAVRYTHISTNFFSLFAEELNAQLTHQREAKNKNQNKRHEKQNK
ncbi:hypothetical protein DAPPUDRAFT_309018 [Daphnia pulex]|uniref:Uncharacterized protein n=1 Tax=Daphnia pulex TaxID=6669 RepID=E9G3Z1_DAPPU|nr:hypothetical protein DAPPUDRAFT_309018 [Daphnia pulex]|eukprot:EFX85902.1 hypothetical protein DAPPUDRAFT_309018 [Daphnia pulex]